MNPILTATLDAGSAHGHMTTHADHRIWQDVYHAPTPLGKEAYIKVTMRAEAPVIQFKER
jgi:motility quorum-sensing regulator / GCU-specific mRNA interferase toxin